MSDSRWGAVRSVLLVAMLVGSVLVGAVGVAAAAVDLQFSGTYDGYDGESTDRRGHEIAVSGEIAVTGSSAVDPRITVAGTDRTVLDVNSVEILVPGDQSIQFDRRYDFRNERVVFATGEVPDGTTLELRFVVYPVGGTDAPEIDAAQIRMNYETASGSRQTERQTVSVSVDDSPERVITSLRNDGGGGGGGSLPILPLFAVIALLVLGVGGFALYQRMQGRR